MNARYKNPDNDPRGDWKAGDCVGNGVRKMDIMILLVLRQVKSLMFHKENIGFMLQKI